MKLKVGMYVRTKWGYICELVNINDFREPSMKYGVEASYLKDIMFIGDEDILKASHNIGEILEAGDFLDFHRIEKIEGTTIFLTDGWFIDFDDVEDLVGTICTEEQFESISYKVGE